ncbi:MAG: hypothetical protein M3083_20745, partial [Actinomycetota bacterium]|nr:hypothetical protein [Actinomycetota bacterium]
MRHRSGDEGRIFMAKWASFGDSPPSSCRSSSRHAGSRCWRERHRSTALGSSPPWASRNRRRREGTTTMSHIIGRPNDDLLDVMLGHGA